MIYDIEAIVKNTHTEVCYRIKFSTTVDDELVIVTKALKLVSEKQKMKKRYYTVLEYTILRQYNLTHKTDYATIPSSTQHTSSS